MIDTNKFKVLTFDCYGTLIDWEGGILAALKPVLLNHQIDLDDNKILELYAKIESKIEKNDFIKYKEVLRKVMDDISANLNFTLFYPEQECLVNSIKNWKPFPDTVEALNALKKIFKLAIISNIDNDLFALSEEQLKVKFDYLITAEEVGSYKPSLSNFNFAIKKINIPSEEILHVAQSIYHDIIPAKKLGIATVWVNRRHGQKGFGATPAATENPDFEVSSLKELAEMLSRS
jgi:2-haloacid dehalogenase